jgi:hypothetical protein
VAIKVERAGSRVVLAQTRRGVRIVAWVFVALAIVGAALSLRQESAAREAERVAVRCSRASGVCEVSRGDGSSQVMRIQSLTGAAVDSDGSGDDARVSGTVQRRDGLPTYWLCEARAGDPEAAGIRRAMEALAAFITDRRVPSVDVECRTRRAEGGTAAAVGRVVGPMIGMIILLGALLLFLVEVRTEVDPDAGLVRVKGRSLVPPRRWSIERPIAEVASVMVRQRSFARERSLRVFIHFKDGSGALVISPSIGWASKIDGWLGELRSALGLPAPPARS